MRTVLLTMIFACAAFGVQSQEFEYHYTFDGTIHNSTQFQPVTGTYGEHGYGPDRHGNPKHAIYFDNGSMFSYPALRFEETTLSFWYKAATEGVNLPQEPAPFQIVGALDSLAGNLWEVILTRSAGGTDVLCVNVISGFEKESLCADFSDSWNNVTFTWKNTDDGELRLYLNGELKGTLSGLQRGTIMQPHYLDYTGRDRLSLLDDVRLYNRILSDEEVEELGEGGDPTSVAEAEVVRSAKVYPSPALDWVTIDLGPELHADYVEIKDQLGRIVAHTSSLPTVSVAHLSAGVYRVQAYRGASLVADGPVTIVR